MSGFKTLLLATDFSEGAEKAASLACSLAELSRGKIVILHVSAPITQGIDVEMSSLARVADIDAINKEIVAEATTRLTKFVENVIQDYKAASHQETLPFEVSQVIASGDIPERLIIKHASEEGADIIVAGTHGRGALSRLFMGSTVEELIRTSPIPVLTTRLKEIAE